MKKCTVCAKYKEFACFGKHKTGLHGLKSRCKKCLNDIGTNEYHLNTEIIKSRNKLSYAKFKKQRIEQTNKWTESNNIKRKEISLNWAKNNKTKMNYRKRLMRDIERRFPITKTIFKQHFKCYYCGANDNKLYYDHVVPISKNGNSLFGNLVASCKSCNSRKKDMLIIQFKLHSKTMGYKLII